MIERAELDIIDICTPAEMHAPLVRLAAARGVAVLCQKPLAGTLAEAEALVAAVGSSARVMVHDNWRFRATYRRIRQWIDAGLVGDIRRVQLEYLSSGMIPDADGQRPALVRQPNFPAMRRLLIGEVLVHHLDTLRFLLGELKLVTATTRRSNDDIIGEDVATLTLRTTKNGTPVLLAGNLAAHGEPPQARDQLRIVGSRATVVLDGYRLSAVWPNNDHRGVRPSRDVRGRLHQRDRPFPRRPRNRAAVRDESGGQPQNAGAGRGGLRICRSSRTIAAGAMMAGRTTGGAS